MQPLSNESRLVARATRWLHIVCIAYLPAVAWSADPAALSNVDKWRPLLDHSDAQAAPFQSTSVTISDIRQPALTTEPASLPWSRTALSLIRKYQQNPLRASRNLALLHAAMHDAYLLAWNETRDARQGADD